MGHRSNIPGGTEVSKGTLAYHSQYVILCMLYAYICLAEDGESNDNATRVVSIRFLKVDSSPSSTYFSKFGSSPF